MMRVWYFFGNPKQAHDYIAMCYLLMINVGAILRTYINLIIIPALSQRLPSVKITVCVFAMFNMY